MEITFNKAAFFFSPRGKRIAKIEGILITFLFSVFMSIFGYFLAKSNEHGIFSPTTLAIGTLLASLLCFGYPILGLYSISNVSFLSRFFQPTQEELKQFMEMKIKKVEDNIKNKDNRRAQLEFEKEELRREIQKLHDEALELISEREELLKTKF